MIILIVHQNCVLPFEPEGQAPVSADLDRPMTGQLLVQRMKIPPWKIHPAGSSRAIQDCHLVFKFPCVSRIDACLRAVPEEPLKARVLERLDHTSTVSLIDTAVNGKGAPSRPAKSRMRSPVPKEPRPCSTKQQLWCVGPAEDRDCADKGHRIQRASSAGRAVTMATTSLVTPLHLSGNTTDSQNAQLQEFLGAAAQTAYLAAIEQLDRHSAQIVLELSKKLKSEVADSVVEIIQRHTVSDKFKDEEVGSNRSYPPTYRVRPVEAQVTELRKLFPSLGNCHEKLARKPLLAGAEAWFAIPRWQALAPTYNEAVEMVLGILATKRRFQNRIIGRLGKTYLRQSERSKLAEKILAEQQQGNDRVVMPAQFGMLHRGCSARRARVAMAGNEFGLGVFAVACMLLTHSERLSADDTLMIDCGGDEYSMYGDYVFDRVPLFDYDISGIEFSMFYEDRSRNLWGTPSGFLYKFS